MKILDKIKNNNLTKSINLSKLNKYLRRHVPAILTTLFLISKKENPKTIAVTTIASLLGLLYMNNNKLTSDNESVISDDTFDSNNSLDLNKILRKKKNRNSSENDLNDFLANNDDDTLLFNIEKELNENSYVDEDKIKNLMKKVNKIIPTDDNIGILTNLKHKLNKKLKDIKEKNYKRFNNKVDKFNNESAYISDISKLNKEYFGSDDNDFMLKINELNQNIPIFNLRSSKNIDFYFNFHLHNADNNKINNLIMCRDIHQWMSSSSLSNDDLENDVYPLYLILKDHKTENEIMIFEVYKIFVFVDENNNKKAFITKGNNFKASEEILKILVELDYVKDLLNGKQYEEYNLSNHHGVTKFLNNILSHFLASESQSGEVMSIDVKQYNENKNTFDYFYHTANYDSSKLFTTSV